MQIILSELHQVTDKIFAHLQEIDVESIELTEDHYWHIPEEQLYAPRGVLRMTSRSQPHGPAAPAKAGQY